MTVAHANGIDIEYYVEGAGPPLLLLAGLGSHAGTSGEPFLKELRSRFRIVRLSNRGMGLTGAGEGTLTIRTMAEDAAALVQSLGIESTHVMGYSMGGYIAQELALGYPQLVRGLILGCTNCGPARSVPQSSDDLGRQGRIMQTAGSDTVRGFCLAMVTETFANREREFIDEIVASHESSSLEGFTRQMNAINAFDSYNRLPEISAPTLLIHGDQDIIISPQNAALLASRIPNASVRMMPGAGHMFMWERPSEVASVVEEFLGTIQVQSSDLSE